MRDLVRPKNFIMCSVPVREKGWKVRNPGARNLSVERCCRSEMAIVDFGGWQCSAAGYSDSCFCRREVVEH